MDGTQEELSIDLRQLTATGDASGLCIFIVSNILGPVVFPGSG